MEKLNIKFNYCKVMDLLDEHNVSEEDIDTVKKLWDIANELKFMLYACKRLNDSNDPFNGTFRSVVDMSEHVVALHNVTTFTIISREKMSNKLNNHLSVIESKADVIEKVMELTKCNSTMAVDPIGHMIDVIDSLRLRQDRHKLKKLIKKFVLKLVTEANEEKEKEAE